MPFPAAILLALYSLGLLTHLLQCGCLSLAGARIEQLRIFYGKPWATFRLSDTEVQLGWIPTGFSSKYDVERFARLPLLLRMTLILVPPLLLVGAGLALLGPERGWAHLLSGFRQFFEGALHPQAVGRVLMTKLEALYLSSPTQALGVVAMKMAAVFLLPFGPTAGMALIELVPRPRREDRAPQMFLIGGVLLTAGCSLSWGGVLLMHALKS